MYYSYFLDVDTSVQPTCTIISTSLTTVTTDGGVIFNGTQNVIIYCLCMRKNVAVAGTRWFFPNGTQVRIETNRLTRPNDPYFRNNVPSVLVIRRFIHPYNGTYGCGPSSNFASVSSQGDIINLILAGMNSLIVYFGKFLKFCYASIINKIGKFKRRIGIIKST